MDGSRVVDHDVMKSFRLDDVGFLLGARVDSHSGGRFMIVLYSRWG